MILITWGQPLKLVVGKFRVLFGLGFEICFLE